MIYLIEIQNMQPLQFYKFYILFFIVTAQLQSSVTDLESRAQKLLDSVREFKLNQIYGPQ